MAAAQRDFYEVLGVPKDADDKAIKSAFRKLAQRFHPDRSEEPDAEERFKEIAEAYAVLSDPEKRRAYDARGYEGVRGFSQEDLYSDLDLGDLFGGFAGGPFGSGFTGGGFTGADLLERLFGVRRGPPRGLDVSLELTLPLERVARGGVETVRFQRPGDGEQQVKLRVPPGVPDGAVLLVRGKGLPAPAPGGQPGDLRVNVVTAPDPRFAREGANLLRTETIPVLDAVLGTHREVPTLEGPVRLKIPAGTQPGQTLRLRGKGLPKPGGEGRGDLLVTVQVRVPKELSAEARARYESIRHLSERGDEGGREPRA